MKRKQPSHSDRDDQSGQSPQQRKTTNKDRLDQARRRKVWGSTERARGYGSDTRGR